MTAIMSHADEINMDSLAVPDFEMQRQSWDVPGRESWRIESRFRQTNIRAKKSTLFQRFNRHYLLIQEHKRTKELPEKVIDLTFVEHEPREIKDNQVKLWAAASVMAVLPPAIIYLLQLPLVWMAAPILLAMILGAFAWRRRRHCFDFVALNSDAVLFSINALGTEAEKVAAFIESLRGAIALGQQQLPDGKRRIPLAVSEMRRLSDQDIITKAKYEEIKRNWFGF